VLCSIVVLVIINFSNYVFGECLLIDLDQEHFCINNKQLYLSYYKFNYLMFKCTAKCKCVYMFWHHNSYSNVPDTQTVQVKKANAVFLTYRLGCSVSLMQLINMRYS